MKKKQNRNIFLDANVICDLLLHRGYHAMNTENIFDYVQKCSVIPYICSYTFAIGYHQMRSDKNFSRQYALKTIEDLFSKVKCIPVDSSIIQQAMNSGFDDFEDAIQYCCALKIPKCEVIITRDTKDFALSIIHVATPRIFLRSHLTK